MNTITVTETFFSVEVLDMRRATAFYVKALGARVTFASPGWSSLMIAGVRIGLALKARHEGAATALHFAVYDLERTGAQIEQAGGSVSPSPVELTPGVVLVRCRDSEANTFTLTRSAPRSVGTA